MRKTRIFFLGLVLSGLVACNNSVSADKAIVADKQEVAPTSGTAFKIDSTNSRIRFTGYGVGKNHPGNFTISGGNILVDENNIKGGQFTIDISSMKVEEAGAVFQEKLKPHLLSADFLDAEKFQTATFEITEVKPYSATGTDNSVVKDANYQVSGNLTIKDQTKNISFPAQIDLGPDGIRALANFNIDRTQWNIRYGNDKSLGDKFISETVNVQLNLVANP